jgi:serine protease inhibitor
MEWSADEEGRPTDLGLREDEQMNRFLAVMMTLVALVVFSMPMTVSAQANASLKSRRDLVKGNGEFAVQMYQNLAAKKGNLFFSPLSVSWALGMTYVSSSACL